MIIQDISNAPESNLLMDAGLLNEQIAEDFGNFAAGLKDKLTGDPAHDAPILEKIQYASQIAALAANGADAAPVVHGKDEFYNLTAGQRHACALFAAQAEIERLKVYDTSMTIVERQSMHPDDWYLWTAAAPKLSDQTWSVWTLNLSTGGLSVGHYGLRGTRALNKALACKKGVIAEN